MPNTTREELIKRLCLYPLEPEGGFYTRTYIADSSTNNRSIGSAIYYLIDETTWSEWHVLDCDEIYHFYQGDQVKLKWISPNGEFNETLLGAGGEFQKLVPKGAWQSLKLANPSPGFALLGTTCFPAFQFEGFTLSSKQELEKLYPNLKGRL